MDRKKLFLGVLLLYGVVILTLAMVPSLGGKELVSSNDKLLHFLEFFLFGLLVLKTLSLYKPESLYTSAFSVSIVFVLISEIVQLPIVGRAFSAKDMIADLGGIMLAFMVYFAVDCVVCRFSRGVHKDEPKA